jgi:hypothetical protein
MNDRLVWDMPVTACHGVVEWWSGGVVEWWSGGVVGG